MRKAEDRRSTGSRSGGSKGVGPTDPVSDCTKIMGKGGGSPGVHGSLDPGLLGPLKPWIPSGAWSPEFLVP